LLNCESTVAFSHSYVKDPVAKSVRNTFLLRTAEKRKTCIIDQEKFKKVVVP